LPPAGTVVASAAEGETFEVLADGATIRPAGPHTTIAQVTWISANKLLLTSSRGTLLVFMDNETETIESGGSYRLEVQPEPQRPQGAGSGNGPPYSAGHSHNHFILIVIAAVAVATAIGVWRLMVSPYIP
jgi:hypothetical protein